MKFNYQPEKCIGCHLCELACSGHKEGQFNPGLARLQVLSRYRSDALVNEARLCDQCLNCVEVCPTGAILTGEQGLTLDRDQCTNCGACVDVCPTGVLRNDKDGFPLLCDGCQGSPRCVHWCPHGALTAGEVH